MVNVVTKAGTNLFHGDLFEFHRHHRFNATAPFAAINPAWEARTLVAPEGFPLASVGEVDRERRTVSYSGKLTWQAAETHKVDASFFGDPSKGEMGPQRTTSLLVDDTSSFSELDFGGHNQTVRYDGVFGSKFLLEGSFAHCGSAGAPQLPALKLQLVLLQLFTSAVVQLTA